MPMRGHVTAEYGWGYGYKKYTIAEMLLTEWGK